MSSESTPVRSDELSSTVVTSGITTSVCNSQYSASGCVGILFTAVLCGGSGVLLTVASVGMPVIFDLILSSQRPPRISSISVTTRLKTVEL